MKKAIIFNLDLEIIEELNRLENRSSFLNDLLLDYFSKTKALNELKMEKMQEAEKTLKEIKEIDEKLLYSEKAMNEERTLVEEEKKKILNSDRYKNKKKEILRYGFEDRYKNTLGENKDTLFEEYFEMLSRGTISNLIQYEQLRGLKKYERKEDSEKNIN